MSSRRKFLQNLSLLSATSLIAKNAVSMEKGLHTLENKVLGGSVRNLNIVYALKPSNTTGSHKIAIAAKADSLVENEQVLTYTKGLIKSAVVFYHNPIVTNGDLCSDFVKSISEKAAALKNNGYQMVLVYVNTAMPEAKKIIDKDFWIAQCHSVDVLFTNGTKKTSHSRVCQDKNRQELIIATLNHKDKKELHLDFMFDIGLQKKSVMIA